MNTMRTIAAAILLCFWLLVAIQNWRIFWHNAVRKGKYVSSILLFGGIAGALGALIMPLPVVPYLFWVPLLLDWGTIPMLVMMCARLCKRSR